MALNLNDKPFYVGLGIGLVIAIVLVVGVHFWLVEPMNEQIRADSAKIAELDKKIEQGRAAERKLQQFRAEVDRLQEELEKLRRILPSTRNTEEIIQKLKALVDQGDFVLVKLVFPRLGTPKAGDPYAEWPIAVSVRGRYHELAILFNRLGNYSRIINVEQIVINALPSQIDRTISADFIAKTFVYVEPTVADDKDTKNKKKPAAQKEGGE